MTDTIDLNLPPKDKVIRMLELMSTKSNFEWISDFLSDNYTYNGEASPKKANRVWLKKLHRKYPGMTFAALQILAEGQLVSVRWKLSVHAYKKHGSGFFRGTNIMRFERSGELAENNQDDVSGRKHFFPDSDPMKPIDHEPYEPEGYDSKEDED